MLETGSKFQVIKHWLWFAMTYENKNKLSKYIDIDKSYR